MISCKLHKYDPTELQNNSRHSARCEVLSNVDFNTYYTKNLKIVVFTGCWRTEITWNFKNNKFNIIGQLYPDTYKSGHYIYSCKLNISINPNIEPENVLISLLIKDVIELLQEQESQWFLAFKHRLLTERVITYVN